MIVVIADDMAGAAELAGAGFDHGLRAEVHTDFDPGSSAEVLAVDTDTRRRPPQEAARRVAATVSSVRQSVRSWVFKKVDSVLRGPVLGELTSLLAAVGKARVLLVPANPSRGRVIRGGRYFVDGLPLERTSFAADPEYPARSSGVLELLGAGQRPDVHILRPHQEMPANGILVGDAVSQADLACWARRVDDSTLAAGAADFFAALLAAKGHQPGTCETPSDEVGQDKVTLFICGSAAAWEHRRRQCTGRGIPVVPMPRGLLHGEPSPPLIRRWTNAITEALNTHRTAMAAVAEPVSDTSGVPHALVQYLAELVEQVLATRNVDRLLVEGGGTASALVRRLGWTPMTVRRQYAPGIVAMQISGRPRPILTVKPGSYAWPPEVWPCQPGQVLY